MIDLNSISTKPDAQFEKEWCKEKLREYREQLFELQNVLYADGRFGILIVLQGLDSSGKDGVCRHVMTAMNPTGIHVKSFKKPTEEELKHDFLWRIYPHIPKRSMIQVFNRSYYEDLLVPRITGSLSEERLQHRINLATTLEDHLFQNSIHVLKFYLHISQKEQIRRIEERLTDPTKKWKYAPEDIRTFQNYDKYITIHNEVLSSCNDPQWHVIPSDKRWYRNYAIAKIMTEHLQSLNLKYPV
jgi:PPK2 family polyphosphate:nucleotide phosphotransferase